MKTIVHVVLTDEERLAIGGSFMVGRKDVTKLVNEFIEGLKTNENTRRSNETGLPTNEEAEAIVATVATAERDTSLREFVPSRGDEPYLYCGEDPELTDACRSVLDGLEFIDRYAWTALERNRK